jgi:hypothetical protein
VWKAALAVVALFELAMIGAGVFLIVQRETGTRARATVTDCVERGSSRNRTTHCTGTWVVGGDLVGGNGRVVVGEVDGATSSDIGKTIDVTLRGGTAYTRSLTLPILLLGFGLALPVLVGAGVLNARRR